MIEQAPQIEKTEQAIPLMVKFQMNGNLQKIQDEYLYWDKIKYKACLLYTSEIILFSDIMLVLETDMI